MTFSIKAIIRAWSAPSHRLSCSSRYWRSIIAELERRGGRVHEAGAFLLGIEQQGRLEVYGAIFYDDLDPSAYENGICVLHGGDFARLWSVCREKNLTVVADVHTHPGGGYQSSSDRTNPMVARAGHIAIIVPNFGRWPIEKSQLGVYEYRGWHDWIDRSPTRAPQFFYTGLWS
jgi:proteasome lid subunit RPN8/RPN11